HPQRRLVRQSWTAGGDADGARRTLRRVGRGVGQRFWYVASTGDRGAAAIRLVLLSREDGQRRVLFVPARRRAVDAERQDCRPGVDEYLERVQPVRRPEQLHPGVTDDRRAGGQLQERSAALQAAAIWRVERRRL